MGWTADATVHLYVQECVACGIQFGMPNSFDNKLRENHKTFYCPNGHSQFYSGESEAQKLKKQLTAERDRAARVTADLDQTKATLRATKGVVTRQRKRLEKVVAGVCPVDGCHRHFQDLRRHIATKHPDYQGGVG